MPRYDYACPKCGHRFEAQQKMSDDPLVTCPNCKEDALERLVSKTSFTLKGSGWYADGYGSSAGADAKTAKPESKSESKPAESTSTTETKKTETPKPAKDGGD